jgi:hypothetical protein
MPTYKARDNRTSRTSRVSNEPDLAELAELVERFGPTFRHVGSAIGPQLLFLSINASNINQLAWHTY